MNQQPIDMSPKAIDQRLREVSQLHQLGLMLKTAKKTGKAKNSPKKHDSKDDA